MKLEIVSLSFLSTLFVASTVFAGTIHLQGGESLTINANTATTVICGAGQASEKILEYSFCECVSSNINNVDMTQALLTVKYSDSSFKNTSILKEYYNTFGNNNMDKCQEFLASVPQCRK